MTDGGRGPHAEGSGKRNPVVAAVFSLLWPGIGQLYNGRWRRALVFAVAVPLLGTIGLFFMVRMRVSVVNLLPVLLGLGAKLVAIGDAARGAGRAMPRRPRFSHPALCTALIVGGVLVLGPLEAGAIRTVAQAFAIPTGGMEPTVLVGDHLLVDKLAYGLRNPWSGRLMLHRRDPERGEIIAFLFPQDRNRVFLKRVIGVADEVIAIEGRNVLVDGVRLTEPYAQFTSPGEPDQLAAVHWGPTRIPAGQLFVLGDNRDNSRDSRFWGFVPVADVLGKATMVYYSVEPVRESRGAGLTAALTPPHVRWQRLGRVLD